MSAMKNLYQRHEINGFIICKENEFYISYIEKNNDLNGSGIEYLAKFINKNNEINIINNMNEIMISLNEIPIIYKYFNQFESGINWICNNCLFLNKSIFNRCICCDKKRKIKLNYNKEIFWNKMNNKSFPIDSHDLIWKNNESIIKFMKYEITSNFQALFNENQEIFEYQFDFKDLSDGFYVLSQSIYFWSICNQLTLSFLNAKNLTKCIKFINNTNKKNNKKIKQMVIIKNSEKRKNENARFLESILTYFNRMDSYYPFLAFLYHYTKYQYSWVVEEIDDDFTMKLDEIEEEIVTTQYLTKLIISIKYPTIQCIDNYYNSTNDQFDENKQFPLFCLQITSMRNQIIINQNENLYHKEKNFQILKQKENEYGNGINTLLMISFSSQNSNNQKLNYSFYNKFIFCILKGFRIKGIHFTFCSNINQNMFINNQQNELSLNDEYDVWIRNKKDTDDDDNKYDDDTLIKKINDLQNNIYSSYKHGFIMGCTDFMSFIKTKKELQSKNIDNKLLKYIIYENSTKTKWFDQNGNKRIAEFHDINFKKWNPKNSYSVSANLNNVLYNPHNNDNEVTKIEDGLSVKSAKSRKRRNRKRKRRRRKNQANIDKVDENTNY